MATDRIVFPKQQLEIVQVQEPKGYGTAGKELLPIMAKNLSLQEGDPGRGKSWKYTVFNQALQDYIKPLAVGARFLADIEERERPDSQYGPDRNINQIYVDGNPVSQKQGGGGWKGRSLEDDLVLEGVKRRSIEGQTAIAQVGNVLTCPTPIPGEALGIDEESWNRILGKYWQAIERSLDTFLGMKTEYVDVTVFGGPKESVAVPPKRDQKPQDKQGKADKPAAEPKDTTPPSDPIKHVGDLFGRAQKLKPPVTRDDLVVAMNVQEVSEIKDLEAAWKFAQEMSKSRGESKTEIAF